MRVAVIFFSGRNRERMMGLAKALGRGIEKQGHAVDVYDGVKDSTIKLTMYQYVVLGAEPAGSFGGRIPEAVKTYLAGAGAVTGRKSYAFVPKAGFGAAKALAALMKCMEGEGMFLKNSDILRSPVEAEEIGRRLRVI